METDFSFWISLLALGISIITFLYTIRNDPYKHVEDEEDKTGEDKNGYPKP